MAICRQQIRPYRENVSIYKESCLPFFLAALSARFSLSVRWASFLPDFAFPSFSFDIILLSIYNEDLAPHVLVR